MRADDGLLFTRKISQIRYVKTTYCASQIVVSPGNSPMPKISLFAWTSDSSDPVRDYASHSQNVKTGYGPVSRSAGMGENMD